VSDNSDRRSLEQQKAYFGALAFSRSDRALAAAEEIQNSDSQADVLRSLAEAQAAADQFTEA
jgi:hypothetical protein